MEKKQRVFVISPGYPSLENPYICAFVHTRVKEYLAQGLAVEVCSINEALHDEDAFDYEFDGIRVRSRNIKGIRTILRTEGPFGVIVTHMPSAELLNVLERESVLSEIVVVSHGADVLCERYACTAGMGYFMPDEVGFRYAGRFESKKRIIRRLANSESFHWIFVSEHLKTKAEKVLGVAFGVHAEVIPNWIREDRFVPHVKAPEDRKKVFFCRRFDNVKMYCIDTVVLAIQRLAGKPYFSDMEFHIYGDGNDYERLVAPLLQYDNVILHRYFVTNEALPAEHAKYGIGLFPSRYDSQGVAISEAAASGLVVIGGDIPVIRDVYPQDEFGMLVHPDSPDDIVARIDELYNDPARFVELSRKMSERVRARFCKSKTVEVECAFLKRLLVASRGIPDVTPVREPALSVIVPSYNMEHYLDVCVGSLLKNDNIADLEVIIVNDGSKDSTLAIARSYECRYPGIVRVLDKANGGHGSCINEGVKIARGRYIRVLDADDWFVYYDFGKLLARLRTENTDCVITNGKYDYVETGAVAPILTYDNMVDGQWRSFDEVQFEGYGFWRYGPILSTCAWKRDVVLKSRTFIMERVSFADTLWNAFPLRCAQTMRYYDLDVYRYTIGRPGQTVSRENVARLSGDQYKVFAAVAEFALNDKELTAAKRYYLFRNVLAEVGCNTIYALHCAGGSRRVREFMMQWGRYPELMREIVRYALRQDGDSLRCLLEVREGRRAVSSCRKALAAPSPAKVMPKGGGLFAMFRRILIRCGCGSRMRELIKGVIPYGIVRMWQKKIYKF